MKKIILLGVLISITAVGSSFACEMSFTLNGSRIIPGQTISLEKGKIYTLEVTFVEDHGNCQVAPEDTDFLLEDEKWKTSKDYLPLVLSSDIVWKDISAQKHVTTLVFTAQKTGKADLQIIRDCSKKAGYDEVLYFMVK